MYIKSHKKTYCVNGCSLFNDKSPYNYWEDRKVTSDEEEIVNYINQNRNIKKNKILHVGIGNSFFASNIRNFEKIDGVTISSNEINLAKNLNLKNYNVSFLNKYSNNEFLNQKFRNYDLIIDVNLKSYSCCNIAFKKLFSDYVSILNPGGFIFTGKKGMNWSRMIKPIFSFSFKRLLHKKLKEVDGKENNLLKIEECKQLSNQYKLELKEIGNSNVVYFKMLG